MVDEKKTPTIKEQELMIEGLGRYHKKIILVLKKWVDMPNEYLNIVSLWIIGTYFHKQFSAYPYLFFNAFSISPFIFN